jgi:urease accessory protein
MVGGGALALAGFRLPLVEVGIVGSVLVLGVVLLTAPNLPVWVPMAVAGGFGLFHGFAHGAELPAGSSPVAYVAGFVAATVALHGLGIATGLAVRRMSAEPPAGKP